MPAHATSRSVPDPVANAAGLLSDSCWFEVGCPKISPAFQVRILRNEPHMAEQHCSRQVVLSQALVRGTGRKLWLLRLVRRLEGAKPTFRRNAGFLPDSIFSRSCRSCQRYPGVLANPAASRGGIGRNHTQPQTPSGNEPLSLVHGPVPSRMCSLARTFTVSLWWGCLAPAFNRSYVNLVVQLSFTAEPGDRVASWSGTSLGLLRLGIAGIGGLEFLRLCSQLETSILMDI